MKVATILQHIDDGYMALPEFQRGYVWNRDQVKGLMESLYRRHPIGGLLDWVTKAEGTQSRRQRRPCVKEIRPLAPIDARVLSGEAAAHLDGRVHGEIACTPDRFAASLCSSYAA